MSLTFDMGSAGDCLRELKSKIEQFEQDDLNTALAMECAIASWTVVDWVFKFDGSRLGHKKLRSLQDELRSQCQALSFLQDIANARKHGEVSHYTPLVKSTKTHVGDFNNDFNHDFDISRLVIHTGTEEFDFQNILNDAYDFYLGYFTKNEID